jgi:hypothetical protein
VSTPPTGFDFRSPGHEFFLFDPVADTLSHVLCHGNKVRGLLVETETHEAPAAGDANFSVPATLHDGVLEGEVLLCVGGLQGGPVAPGEVHVSPLGMIICTLSACPDG